MENNSGAILLLELRIAYYDRCIISCLEYMVDKAPKRDELIMLKEQRILYTMFRDDLIKMRDALK